MNTFRKYWLEERERNDQKLFDKIKDNPKPEISDLWALSEDLFIEWRKIHDFPQLLNHFDNVLLLFKEWKKDNNISNDIIIENGEITPFIERKRFSKRNKKLYLIQQISDNEKQRTFVSYKKLNGNKEYLGKTYNLKTLKEFVSYLDWLKDRGKTQNILYINSRQSPNSDNERVFIHADIYAPKSDFELLKMGGIKIPTDDKVINRGKQLEFVNLCGLKLEGELYFGEQGNLSCSYCACDNWIADNIDMALLRLSHCSINNFKIYNSKIQQWDFYDCQVTGDFYNTKLYSINIIGGAFNPIMLDCTLSEANIWKDKNIIDANGECYRIFKKIYQNQGDDDIAKKYYVKEKEFIRQHSKGWGWLTKTLSYYYWEYGSKPHRIIYYSIGAVVLFALVFYMNASLINNLPLNSELEKIGNSLYFSAITFTTLGYGDLSPTGWMKTICSIEALLGLVNMGFLIAGYTNTKY